MFWYMISLLKKESNTLSKYEISTSAIDTNSIKYMLYPIMT